MNELPEGNAIVYCEGFFNTPNGKTAHGLVRFTRRYDVKAVIDSRFAGQDAGMILDGKLRNIPVMSDLNEAFRHAKESGAPATHLVVGLAPDGGRLSDEARVDIKNAIDLGLHVDSGLHDFLSVDKELAAQAESKKVTIRDVRKPPNRDDLHFFSGKIEQVKSFKVAVLGVDSAIGKRTTAWLLVHAFEAAGSSCELIGTGQTAWMQGVRHGIILDSLVNDFVSGEIEHAVWSAWDASSPEVIVLEGQGSLMNPAYPGGFELLAAGRPDVVIMQYAPARTEYDGFPGYTIHPLAHQIEAVEILSGKPVVAITINHENLKSDEIMPACAATQRVVGIPAFDVLFNGAEELVALLRSYLADRRD